VEPASEASLAKKILIAIKIKKIAWGATGYIYWPAVFFVTLASMLFAPLGTWLAHQCHVKIIRYIFAVLLLVTAFELVKT
jgi:uncharacterized membrane protein YfcA